MKTMAEWFDEYGESHQHPINKRIHWVCVPVITLCVAAVVWKLSALLYVLSMVGVYWFFSRMSEKIAYGMVGILIACLILIALLPKSLLFYGVLFVVAWIGQFIGHHIEGKKPSFFKDLQFLLIGPAWLLHFTYERRGIQW